MQDHADRLLAPVLAEWPHELLPGVRRGVRKAWGRIAGGLMRSLPERMRSGGLPGAGILGAGRRAVRGIVLWGFGSGHWRGRIVVAAGAGGALSVLLANGGAGGVVGLAGWFAGGGWDAWPPGRAAGQPWPWWAMSWRAGSADLLAWGRVLDCFAWPLALAWTAGLLRVGGTWRRRMVRSAGAVAIAGGVVLVPWSAALAWGWRLDVWEPAAWGRLWRFLEGGGAVPWPMVLVAGAGPVLLALACVAVAVRPDVVWSAGVSVIEGMRVRELAAGVVRAGVRLAWWPLAVVPALLLDWLYRRDGGARQWFAGTHRARWLAFWIAVLLVLAGTLDVDRLAARAGAGMDAVLVQLDPFVPGAARPLAVGPLDLPPAFRTRMPPWPREAWLALPGALGGWLADAVLGNLGRLLAIAVTALGAVAAWSVLAVAGLQLLAWGWRLLARAAATDAAEAGARPVMPVLPAAREKPDGEGPGAVAGDAAGDGAPDAPADQPREPDPAADVRQKREAVALERQLREAREAHREAEDAREEQAVTARTLDVFKSADDRAEANEIAFNQMQRELPGTVPPPDPEGPDDPDGTDAGQTGEGARASVAYLFGGPEPAGSPPPGPAPDDPPDEPAGTGDDPSEEDAGDSGRGAVDPGDGAGAPATVTARPRLTWDLPERWAWLGDPPAGLLALPSGKLDALDDEGRRQLVHLDGLGENRTVVQLLPCPDRVMLRGGPAVVPWPDFRRPLDDDARDALSKRLLKLRPPGRHVEARMTQLLRELLWLRLLPDSGMTPALRCAELLVAGDADLDPLRELPELPVFDGADLRTRTGEPVPGASDDVLRALRAMRNWAAGIIDHEAGADPPWRMGAALRPAAAP